MSPLDTIPGPVVRLDRSGCIQDLCSKAKGLNVCLEIGGVFRDMLDTDAASRLSSILRGPLDRDSNHELEANIGQKRFRLTVGSAPETDGTRLLQLTDITEFRALSRALAWNEQRYRSLFSENPDAVFSQDLEGRFVEVNQATVELTGYLAGELVKLDWQDIVDPACRVDAKVSFMAALAGNPCSFPCRIINRQGRVAIVQITHFPILVGGDVVGVFAVARDKTERYRLEESRRLLQTCVDQIHEVIIITEMDGDERAGTRIKFVNQAVSRITGYRPDELIGRSPKLFQGEATDKAALQRIRAAQARREPITEEIINYRRDGTPFWNEMEIVPVPASREDEPGHFVSVLRDVTELKQWEAELQHSREELRRLSQAQDSLLEEERRRMARDLHDELGQSLTALKLNIGVALNQSSGLPASYIQRLRLLAQITDGMIEQVREIAANLRPAMLDDLGFETTAEWFLEQCADREGTDVQWHAQLDTDGRVKGDVATTLFRILQECMTNISRHAKASAVNVWYQESPERARLVVVDNGVGFDPGAVGKRGLGLIGIRERVALLDGDLLVESALGKGVRIVVSLPLTGEAND